MRNILIVMILGSFIVASAQSNDRERMIRELEQKEALAVLQKDTATLKEVWSKHFTVNNPLNKISKPGADVLDRQVIHELSYSTFNRTTEHVLIQDETAICMGKELVIETGREGNPGKTIHRRYTNIWMKQDAYWKLIARHANQICE